MGKESQCEIQWQDVHKQNELVGEIQTDLEFVRERLHVMDENGRLQVGFAAFLAIWRNSPKEKWKSTLLGLPGIRQICSLAYNIFALGLYKWNRSKQRW